MDNLRNFYDLYGFIHFKNVIPKESCERFIGLYDKAYAKHYNISQDNFNLENEEIIYPPIIDYLAGFTELDQIITLSGIWNICKIILGKDFLYHCNDLSTFRGGSNWHRDQYTDFKVAKLGIYLQSSNPSDGGQFVIVPGSHRFGDQFGESTVVGLKWPNGSGYTTDAPIGTLEFNSEKQNWIGSTEPAYHEINITQGDLILFDSRAIHGVKQNTNRFRRLIAIALHEGRESFLNRYSKLNENDYYEKLYNYKAASVVMEKIHGREPIINNFNDRRLFSSFLNEHSYKESSIEIVQKKVIELTKNPNKALDIIMGK